MPGPHGGGPGGGPHGGPGGPGGPHGGPGGPGGSSGRPWWFRVVLTAVLTDTSRLKDIITAFSRTSSIITITENKQVDTRCYKAGARTAGRCFIWTC
ncbi:hypothetical protein ASPZODRAFT_1656045 [Penicilliopsis zonata CBS 506.65]|uniref:Uncharacterized protein n=1 Tax=Penicilliopsis zonata CBS 506.65 TaxID=1073090 RepID=A0A1L9SNJ7_9EURO|nr:hypothetical protein ASPZODRAFT_1656045 [Penicilliopsis zonata CBS 506.65]OJJ48683.1 hypothetical protein ASPZODRAFT_1656045 [Penicilliopsis zonata CBS 506.65]